MGATHRHGRHELIGYYQELLKFLTRATGDRQTAADLVQAAYLRLLDRSSAVEIQEPRALLYRTAINLSIDLRRRERVRQDELTSGLEAEEVPTADCPHEGLARDQQLALLRRALEELPPACREAFLLRKLEGLSHVQIAEQLGLSKASVEKHIVNAMRHCRLRLLDWNA
ncbi:sigma-70 family RNA polymerase sigma factor [Pseudomonas sp. EpS/L25]|uniref:sigma-70 family RNA polymerase sigma factor n=1 Tax=Pseudomonas sp. EpS/L25 TaxID=1749078 RepID=UPI0007433B6B|nr:RNA polymerase subunit sigma [Pseudomonas sp. EpS/L25]